VAEVLPVLREVERAVERGLWAVGFLAYEAAPGLDPALRTRPPGPLPLAWFGVFPPPRREPPPAAAPPATAGAPPAAALDWEPSLDEAGYHRAVASVRAAIERGETYQVNLTWRLRAPFAGSAAGLFAALHGPQRVPHAALLDLGDHALVSLSPELFFRRRGDRVVCRPMKGTAPRGRFPEEDAAFAAALAASEKERAENLMIVDMVRNDLGRVAVPGSVRASRLFRLERYATVWQMTSTVSARTEAPLHALIAALFPSASVTGAPKPSTMRIIAGLEGAPRGAYCGAIGWVGPGGRARFNVAIRTVWVDRTRGVAEYGTGGGVTWDSSAEAELAESRLKARLLLAPPRRFALLETMLWRPRWGWWLLPEHLARLRVSARHLGFRLDPAAVERELTAAAAALPPRAHRARLLVARDGAARVEVEPLGEAAPGPRARRLRWRVALAAAPIDPREPLLFHKTTWREPYDAALAAAPRGCDDVLLWNPAGELTESTRANLVVRIGGRLLTPPVACGLLAGTLRARLLARGRLAEAVVRREDLARCEGLWLINSVRGWIRVELG
jgi:para-aminobenzoate synthetase/4-amino-4-deoxychorismate lyase